MVILEIQKSNKGTVGIVPPVHKADPGQADQQYCTQRGAAAVSAVNVHTVVLLTDEGEVVERKTYYHGELPEAE